MKRKIIRICISLTLSVVIFATASLTSFAASPHSTYTGYADVEYESWCYGEKNNYTISSNTRAETINGSGMALSHWIGLSARIIDSYNQIVSTSGYVYNSSPTTSMSVYTTRTVPGTYTAEGTSMLLIGYNNNGGMIYYCTDFYDPVYWHFFPSSSAPSPSPYSFRAAALSGSNDRGSEDSDLMRAVGVNGITGYISNSDMLANPYYVSDSEGTLSGHFIPVYDLEGNVVDTFELTGGYTLEPAVD